MKSMSRFKNTFQAIGVLIAVFALYQFALAQDISETPVVSEESVSEISQDQVTEINSETPEVLGESVENSPVEELVEVIATEDVEQDSTEVLQEEMTQEVPGVTIEDIEQEKPGFFEKILDIFVDEPEEIIEEETQTLEEEYIEEAPFVFPQNLPEISAIPIVKEFTADVDAVHVCWIDSFSVDMQFLPNKTNTVMINNPTIGPATLDITGIPPGFDIFFKDNKSQSISISSSQQEVPFVIKKQSETQDGSFNVVFVFTKKTGGESIATCQMNLIN